MGQPKFEVYDALDLNQQEIDSLVLGGRLTGRVTMANVALTKSVIFRDGEYTHATIDRIQTGASEYSGHVDEGRLPFKPVLEICLKEAPTHTHEALRTQINYAGFTLDSSFVQRRGGQIEIPVLPHLLLPVSCSLSSIDRDGDIDRRYFEASIGTKADMGEYAQVVANTIEVVADTVHAVGYEAMLRQYEL